MIVKLTDKIAALTFVALTVGCTSYSPAYLDKDARSYHIYCGGEPYASTDDCTDRAQSICSPNGYTLIAVHDPQYVHSQTLWDQSTHDIVVQCAPPMVKEPASATPDVNFTASDQPQITQPTARAVPESLPVETYEQYPADNKDWPPAPPHIMNDTP